MLGLEHMSHAYALLFVCLFAVGLGEIPGTFQLLMDNLCSKDFTHLRRD